MATIVERFNMMPLRNKVIMLAVLGLSIAAVVFFVSWSQQADFQVLYGNLADSDAGMIVQKLKEMKVPYRLEAGSILVPAARVYDIRLQLASQGLPHGGGIGFELFDKTDFGATDFVQKLNYRRALQGELARTISSLSEVEQCRVHLAMPEKSLFVREQERPSASVLVKLRTGRSLSAGQVQGIVHLVSSSIEGLNPREVTVIDNRGEMLTRPSDGVAGLSSSQLEYQRSFEKEMESRVLGILEPVAGRNRVKAKVTASLDFTKIEKTEEKFDPDGQVVRSEQKNVEKSSTNTSGGVPGVASNLPNRSAAQASGTQGQSQKQNETVNYEISRVTSHIVNAQGEVKKLSVAVIVDGTYAAGEAGAEPKYVPRNEEDLKRYEDLAKKAVGFTAERGDEVRVVNMQFEGAAREEIAPAPRNWMPAVLTGTKIVLPLVAVVLFFLFVARPLMNVVTAPVQRIAGPAASPAELGLPKGLAELEQALGQKGITMQPDVVEWAKQNPDQAAGVIRGWIGEQ